MQPIKHIHHISAIVGDAQETVDFYQEILGLRFIKQTVNYDDPTTYHIYFSNKSVDNGTIITFFNWNYASKGRVGSGQVGTIAFRIPKGSMTTWKNNLLAKKVQTKETMLFQQPTLELTDTHGLALALVEGSEASPTIDILGFHGAVLLSAVPSETAHTLTEDLGLLKGKEDDTMHSFFFTGESKHHLLIPKTPYPHGRWGIGTVHHLAFAVPTSEEHRAWQDYLYNQRYGVTEIKERHYFKAMYFQEPGDIIFELATDTPGFTIDESYDNLGQSLMLPSWFESSREQIAAKLVPKKIETRKHNDSI